MLALRVLGTLDLSDAHDAPLTRVLSQPKRVALLVYLAVAEPRGYHRRDELLGLFWPEWTDRRARNALNQSLTFLRKNLAPGTVLSRGSEEVRVDPERIWCDAVAFAAAVEGGDHATALDLYRGPFLHAFHLGSAEDFARWAEERRQALRERAARAAWQLARSRLRAGRLVEAEEKANLALSLLPTDEAATADFAAALVRAGDRVAAVRLYEALRARLGEALEVGPSFETRRRMEHILATSIRSIAVLPLQDLSGSPEQEYFAVGMTEALTGSLAGIAELRVTSATSARRCQSTGESAAEIARALGVDALVEGCALREGGEVHLMVRLVHGATDHYVWSESYRRDSRDALVLQSEVARAIAEEVQVTLSPAEEARLDRSRPVDPEAHRFWLKGNFHLARLDQQSNERAIEAYREAVARDDRFAPGHAGLAMALVVLAEWHSSTPPGEVLPEARQTAERALALDPTLPQAHIALGRALQTGDWDWQGADRCYRRGIELNPSDSMGRIVFVNFLTAMGRFEEAISTGRIAVERDPLTPQAWNELGHSLYHARRDEESLRAYREALGIDPDPRLTHLLLTFLHDGASWFELATRHLDQAVPRDADLGAYPPNWVGYYGYFSGRIGRVAAARAALSHLLERRECEYVPATAVASAYWGLRDRERTIAWLERAFRERDPYLVWLNASPWLAPLRSEPEIQDILRRMNLSGSC